MGSATPIILLADDVPDVVEALALLLKAEGFSTLSASSPADVLHVLETRDVDVALLDLNYARDTTSGLEGFALLAKVRALDPTLPIVVMTAWSSVEGAVEAMRLGARDYVQKPWDNTRLVTTLRTHVELGRSLRVTKALRDANARIQNSLPTIVAHSPAMQAVLSLVDRVAPSEANVLISGEHGTGKEVIARKIQARSFRADRPFVAVNAGALSDGVFESELFGHVRGAFTDAKTDRIGCFELADQGTLFLDEIGNMPLGQQAKLLRVLQTGEIQPVGSSRVRRVNVRVLAATNGDLDEAVRKGTFREDLLYRLNTVELHLPPLRERLEDIAALALDFLMQQSARYSKPHFTFSDGAMKAMLDYPWPGNVRELEHCVERALLLAQGCEIRAEDLVLRRRGESPDRLQEMTLEEAERYLIERALNRLNGSVSDAARALGVSRSALYRRIQVYGLKVV